MSAAPPTPPLAPWPRSLRLTGGDVLLEGALLEGALLAHPSIVRSRAAGAPESYRLRVGRGGIHIEAADDAGEFYAERTLVQLARAEGGGWVLPAVEIEDAPRFAHRGLMLDVARHFFPVETVVRLIDEASALKLNRLHLHLTDDQGWRLALASRPELTRRASEGAALGDAGGFYTADDYRAIVAHAARRHMIVIPEIDMPGHTHAVGLAYPELAAPPALSAEVRATAEEFGQELPEAGRPYGGFAVGFSSLRIGEEATRAFVADVIDEVAALTPGPWLHIGGDEALGTPPAAFQAFVAEASARVARAGKTPIAWHEAAATPGAAVETIGQYWGYTAPEGGADADARAIAARGPARLVLSPADAVYLDMRYEPDDAVGLRWAKGPTPARDAYEWEPAAIIEGVGEDDILGVEAAVWTETIRTEADLERMVFPRVAAAAEIAWSAPRGTPERSWESFRARVAGLAGGWAARGIRFHPADGIAWPE